MKKREAHSTTTIVLPWLKEHAWSSFPWEVKESRGADSIPFSAVEDHQIIALHNARKGILSHKESDEGRGQKPCDGYSFHHSEAYLIFFYPDMWCFIDILVFEDEERTSARRSITSSRAREIAYKVIER